MERELLPAFGRVQMLMEMCPDISKFKQAAEKQKKVTIARYLFDEMNQIIDQLKAKEGKTWLLTFPKPKKS